MKLETITLADLQKTDLEEHIRWLDNAKIKNDE